MVSIHGHEAEVEEATELEEDVGVAEDTIHIISHIMAEVSLTSKGVLWVLAVTPMEDIGVTVVVVQVVVVMGVEIITVVMENMVVHMIVKMVNRVQVQKGMIIGVKTVRVEVVVDLLLRRALDTIIVIMSTNTDRVDTY
jgi:hypothetical protein